MVIGWPEMVFKPSLLMSAIDAAATATADAMISYIKR
jgi:hypothetical protein